MFINQRNITTDNANSSVQSLANNKNIPSDDNNHSDSPNLSNNNVTIESLSDGDCSSVVDSDSDIDIEIPKSASDFFRNEIICTSNGSLGSNQGVIVTNEISTSENNNVAKQPQIGSIAVQNSSDITFGNKTFYQGPVTIKQFLLEKNQWRRSDTGADNKGFEASNGDVSTKNGRSLEI